mgnify:CR=1 FL=1
MWISPIIDRTKSDAEYAQQHRDAVVENKGAFNATDLNRIEGNIAYLAEQLRSYGYIVILESIKTDWNEQSTWPKSSEFDRIRRNVSAIREAYYIMQGSPEMDWTTKFDWNDANNLERNLLNINTLIGYMTEGFRRCGTFACGQELILP